MKHKNTSSTLTAPASSLVLPEQLAQQAADAVRELLAEAAAANTAATRPPCATGPAGIRRDSASS